MGSAAAARSRHRRPPGLPGGLSRPVLQNASANSPAPLRFVFPDASRTVETVGQPAAEKRKYQEDAFIKQNQRRGVR